MPSALITGGAGFIGSHVADAFLADGWSVTVLDDLSTGKHENVPYEARLVEASITSPEAAGLVAGGEFAVVVHCAAQMDVRRSVADPLFDAQTNILGTLNLLEAIRTAAKRPRFIYASTGGVLYGDFNTPPNVETFPKDPESPYAIAKLGDYVYVADVVRAVQLAATRELPQPGRLDARGFNIGTGSGTSVNEIARLLQRAARSSSVPVQYAPERPGEQLNSFVAVRKAASELGWEPLVSLDDGLALTYEWFASHAPASHGR